MNQHSLQNLSYEVGLGSPHFCSGDNRCMSTINRIRPLRRIRNVDASVFGTKGTDIEAAEAMLTEALSAEENEVPADSVRTGRPS